MSAASFVTQNGGGVMRPPAGRKHNKHEDEEAGKLFVGGLSWETSQDSLLRYFSRFGEVIDCVVMKNAETGRSRGFGFVTFSDPANMDKVIQSCPHVLDGRTIDPKPCNPRSMQQKPKRNTNWPKVFLGGLPSSITETDLRAFFGRYGEVTEVVIMYDQEKKKARGFGFLSFLTDDAVDRAVVDHYVTIQNKQVEIKRAEPRNTMICELMAAAAIGGGGGSNGNSNGPIVDQWGAAVNLQAANGIHAAVTAAYSGWGAPPAVAATSQPVAATAVPISFGQPAPAAAFSVAAAAPPPLANHHQWGGTPPPPPLPQHNTQPSPSHHHHHSGWGVAMPPQAPPVPNGGTFAVAATAGQPPPPLQYHTTTTSQQQQQHHAFAPPPLANGAAPTTAGATPGHTHSYASYWGSPPGLTPPPPSTPGGDNVFSVIPASPPQHKFEVATGAPPPFTLHQQPTADYATRLYHAAAVAVSKPMVVSAATGTQYSAGGGGPTSPEYFTASHHHHHPHHHVSYVVSEPSRVIMQQQPQSPAATFGGPPVVTTYLSYRRN